MKYNVLKSITYKNNIISIVGYNNHLYISYAKKLSKVKTCRIDGEMLIEKNLLKWDNIIKENFGEFYFDLRDVINKGVVNGIYRISPF